MPNCTECTKTFPSVTPVMFHLQLQHGKGKFDHYSCNETGCYTNFSNWGAFRQYLTVQHKFTVLTNENITVTSKEKNAPTFNKNVSLANEDIQFSEMNSSEQCPESDLPPTDKIKKKLHSTLFSEQLVKFAAR